jgi:tRNA(Ile)-lysidine synthase
MKKINKNIYARVLEFSEDKEFLSNGDNVLLAMSAGKDSMMLLDVFLHLKEKLSLGIGIFHLNHMMRAGESDADEKFIADIARTNNIKLHSFKFDFKHSKPRGVSFEEYARVKRYELLEQVSAENKYKKIATAHNRDDNIETILMRILTGTGIHGLQGIEAKRGNIIRPLLFLSTEEIYGHLRKFKIKWREDSSNKDEKYLRNFVRNSLLPKINTCFNDAGEAIISLSGIAREYTMLIDELLKDRGKLIIPENNSVIIEKDLYIKDGKLFRYVIAKAIRENFGEFVTGGVLEEIYKKACTEKTNLLLYKNKNFSVKKTLINNKKVIVISGNIGYNINNSEWSYKIDLTSGADKDIFLKEISRTIRFRFVDYNYFLNNKNRFLVFISITGDVKEIEIRNRRKGDRINLEHGSKKIKELMIENKLEGHIKDVVPLLVIGSQIAAYMPDIAGIATNRVSAGFHVKIGSKKILAIHSEKL